MEEFEHFRMLVDKGQAPMRIDLYMSTHMVDTSRSRIQQAVKEGYVRVGDVPVKSNYIVRPGDVITFVMPYRPRGIEVKPQDIPLDIVYEDDDVLVVNKPAGMCVHPGHGNYDGTLVNALCHYLGVKPEMDEDGAMDQDSEDGHMGMLVHRIDKDTSGLLLVSKNEEAQVKLQKQFYDHSTERCYWAIVWGDVKEDDGTVDANIDRDPTDRLRFRAVRDPERGKHAVTHYHVLERFGYVTLLECRLETGRTHQIRVHMASIGHPLFNDERYGGSEIRKGTIYSKYKQFIKNCFELCPRQALHAKTLGFTHPKSGKRLQFDSELPSDMVALLDKWRKYSRNMPVEEDEE